MKKNSVKEKEVNEEQESLDVMIKKLNDYEMILRKKAELGANRVTTGIYDDKLLDIQTKNADFQKLREQMEKIQRRRKRGLYSSHVKVDVDFEGEISREEYFIGDESIFIDDKKLVFDLKSKGTIGRALFEARNNKAKRFKFKNIEYDILLDRAVVVDWEKEKVLEVSTRINLLGEEGVDLIVEYSGIADEKLIQLRRDNIISGSLFETVSKEQYKIIKSDDVNSIIVQGCAGSGKTAVMLHKISNYIHNIDEDNKNKIISQIRIITPSTYIKPLYSNMYDSLNLNSIPCKTIEAYYIELLENYSKDIKIDTKVIDEKKLDKEMLKYFYTQGKDDLEKNVINNISNELKKVLPDIKIETIQQIRLAHNEISNELYNLLFKGGLFQKGINEELREEAKNSVLKKLREHNKLENNYYQSIDKIKKYLLKERNRLSKKAISKNDSAKQIIEIKDNLSKINLFEKQILDDFTKGELKDKYLLEITFKKQTENTPDTTHLDKLQEILEGFSYEKVIKNKDYLLKYIINNKEIKDAIQLLVKPEEFGDKEMLEIIDKIFSGERRYSDSKERNQKALLAYIKTDFIFIIEYIVEKYIRGVYNSYNLGYVNHIYRYRLYLYLTIAKLYYDKNSINAYINIDEAQDYSINELNLLSDILGSQCRLDIYGDLNQKLQDYRSINKWKDLTFVNNENVYELDYSYRNTKSIIDFVNSKLGLSIKAVTEIGETVKEYKTFKDALDYFCNLKKKFNKDNKTTETYAIIVPIEVDMEEIMEEIQNCMGENSLKDFIFDDINFEQPELIPVIDVASSKGLEFRNVLVYNKNNIFTENQKYVALTRSIKTLVYCED